MDKDEAKELLSFHSARNSDLIIRNGKMDF